MSHDDSEEKIQPRIGLILTIGLDDKYLIQNLVGWIEAQNSGMDIVSAFVRVPFPEWVDVVPSDGYNCDPEWLTKLKLEISYYYSNSTPLHEYEARNKALNYLLSRNCDYIWIVDGVDEAITFEEIKKTLDYVEQNKFYAWFKTEFKNYTFSTNTYIEGFTPPRIFRSCLSNGARLLSFYYDNDVQYELSGEIIKYTSLSSKVAPKSIFFADHYSWLDNERSRRKIEFQLRHYNDCSFEWKNGHLAFNADYYARIGKQIPKLISTTIV